MMYNCPLSNTSTHSLHTYEEVVWKWPHQSFAVGTQYHMIDSKAQGFWGERIRGGNRSLKKKREPKTLRRNRDPQILTILPPLWSTVSLWLQADRLDQRLGICGSSEWKWGQMDMSSHSVQGTKLHSQLQEYPWFLLLVNQVGQSKITSPFRVT